MSAFDPKHKKTKKMPSNYFIIEDTSNNTWLTIYSSDLSQCQWGVVLSAIHYATQQDADNAIAAWNLGEQTRFIGKNPPIHH